MARSSNTLRPHNAKAVIKKRRSSMKKKINKTATASTVLATTRENQPPSKLVIANHLRPSEMIQNAKKNQNPNWRSIVTLNEDPKLTAKLRKSKKDWDFSNLSGVLEELTLEHPNHQFFLIGACPFVYGSTDEQTCPTLGIIVAPDGEDPPRYVQVFNPEDASEEIVSFSDFGLEWKIFGNRKLSNKIFALKQRHGVINPKMLVRTRLWNLMGDNLNRKDTGELDLQDANFQYQKPNGEWIRENYVKGKSNLAIICNMNDLDYDQHRVALKQAVKAGFDKARREREDHIANKLTNQHSSFANLWTVKVFPTNDVILEHFRKRAQAAEQRPNHEFFELAPTANNDNLEYINEWYGKARRIVPDPNM